MIGEHLADIINHRTGGRNIDIGLVMGSGLSGLVDAVEDPVTIPYEDLQGFPHVGVSGHAPNLVIGTIEGTDVAVFGGRVHYYEDGRADAMRVPLETLKALGAHTVFLANSAGSLKPDIAPGNLMLITDHINFSGTHPLIGEHDEARFVDLVGAYDQTLRDTAKKAADKADIDLKEGVYIWFSGPGFETPAEVRMAALLGADAVGMSTVPEVIIARYLGLKVVALSNITNMGAGLSPEGLSHEQTKAMAAKSAAQFEAMLRAFLKELS